MKSFARWQLYTHTCVHEYINTGHKVGWLWSSWFLFLHLALTNFRTHEFVRVSPSHISYVPTTISLYLKQLFPDAKCFLAEANPWMSWLPDISALRVRVVCPSVGQAPVFYQETGHCSHNLSIVFKVPKSETREQTKRGMRAVALIGRKRMGWGL